MNRSWLRRRAPGSGPGGGIRPVPRRGLAGRLGRSVVTGLLMTASLAVAAASPGIPASAAAAPGAGKITLYSDQVFTGPDQMTAGPDGALWFTNGRATLDRADHHRRHGHRLHRARHLPPRGDHGRPGRGAVVHQRRQQLDRADHHHRDGDQLHRHRYQPSGGDHGRAGRGAVVHQPATTRSGGSPPPGRSPATPAPVSPARRGSRPAATGHCGSRTTTVTRSGGSPPPGP